MKTGRNTVFILFLIAAAFAALFSSCDDPLGTKDNDPYSYHPTNPTSAYTSTIHFDANGGVGTMADQVVTSTSKTQKLKLNAFTRAGYSFWGWQTLIPSNDIQYTDIQYTDGQLLTESIYPYWQDQITLYAVWKGNPYTVHYHANGGQGTMESSIYNYEIGGRLMENAFTRAGFDFVGWALSPNGERTYEDRQNVVDPPPGAEKGAVTLYAVWSTIACTIHYHANGGVGEMADTLLMEGDNSPYLRPNDFFRTGYAFAGWSTSADGSLNYTDAQYVPHLTWTVGATVTLYAVWRARTYTIRYNGNGSTGGSMADSTLLIDVEKNLAPNAFTRANYVFAGWAMSPTTTTVKYTDEQSVKNVTNIEGEIITLYAVWSSRHAYTVSYYGNGNTGGSMADQNFTSGVAQNLRSNDYTRAGHVFLGWSTSLSSLVEYTDGASFTHSASTAGEIKALYAVWKANIYTIVYNANGGTGTMNPEPFTYDTARNLKAIGFARTNYTFAGWTRTPGGTTIDFTDGQSVINLTETAGATINLYAVWKPYTYTVNFNKNHNDAVGTMSSQSFVYGTAQNLYTNSFNRVGYDFAGWAETSSATAPVKYANGQSVNNLTTTNNATVNLYAKWTLRSDSAYTVVFNKNAADAAGSMGSQNFTYDASQKLTANAFTRVGYTFLGWSKTDDATVSTYANGATVTNLTTTMGATVTLYAVWKAKTFLVRYNSNGIGIGGSMADTSFTSGVEQALRKNVFTRASYTFAGWATSASRAAEYIVDYFDEQRVILAEDDAVVTLYAVWYNNYTVNYNGNGYTSGSMTYQSFVYGTAQNLRSNAYTRTGYTFTGWALTADGPVKYADGELVNNITTTTSVTLYAVWAPSAYTVTFNKNAADATGTMESQSFTYGVSQALLKNTFTRPNYQFTGWTVAGTTSPVYTDQQSVSDLDSGGGTVTLNAVWNYTYTVTYDGNGNTGGSTANSAFVSGVSQNLRNNGFTRTGHTFLGWSTSSSATSATYTNQQSVNLSSTAGGTVTLYAVWQRNTYTVSYDKNAADATGTMLSTSFTYDVNQTLRKNTFARTNYIFAGWARTSNATTAEFTDQQSVGNLTATAGGTVPLYAVWQANAYTVKYNGNGSTSGTMADTSIYVGATQSLRTNTFARTNYIFAGWTRTNGGTTVDFTNGQSVNNLSTTAGDVVILYAVWTTTYTVKYNANGGGGTAMPDSTFTINQPQNLPASTFTRLGSTFAGWTRTNGGTTKEFNDQQSVSNLTTTELTVTLYAVWQLNAYTVVYDKGATDATGTMADTSFTYGTAQNLRSNTFARTNYTFAGWTRTPGGTTIDFTDGQSVNSLTSTAGGTVTLYAVWRNHYTVAFNANAATGVNGIMYPQDFVYGTTQNLRANNFTRSGYTFQGWTRTSGGTTKEYNDQQSVGDLTTVAGETVTLYAVWANTYTVKYNANGGTGTMEDSVFTYGVTNNLKTNTFGRTNHRFTGWATTSGGSVVYANGAALTSPSVTGGVLTLYAVWSNTYTVSFDKNASNATGTMTDQIFTIGVAQNLKTNAFNRLNYTFAGWATTSGGSVAYANEERITTSITTGAATTLYAVWRNNYTVHFNANGGTGSMADQNFVYGTSQQLRSNTFSKTGSVFAGWATSSNGSVAYADKASVSTLTTTAGGTVDLYAVWTSPYTVIYNNNGGTGTMANSTFAAGVNQSLSTNTFTRSGCNFIGWATSAVALNGGTVAYGNGASVKDLAAAGGTVTLYAVWRTTYTIHYNPNGANGTMADQNFVYGTAQNLRTLAFTRTGFQFRGWATSQANAVLGESAYGNGASVNNLTETPGATVTLYAIWYQP